MYGEGYETKTSNQTTSGMTSANTTSNYIY